MWFFGFKSNCHSKDLTLNWLSKFIFLLKIEINEININKIKLFNVKKEPKEDKLFHKE